MASNIVFDGTKGISLPSFTTTEKNAIVSPATGAIVYDSTLKQESLYNGTAWVNVNSSGNSAITSGTAVASTSGTSIDFTGIPSWVKRITVMFQGVSTNGTSNLLIQVGSGSVAATGYLGSAMNTANAGTPAIGNFTVGFGINGASASNVYHGLMIICLLTGNVYAASGQFAFSNVANFISTAGTVSLSGVIDRVRITTVNGTDTFDAGSINILYE